MNADTLKGQWMQMRGRARQQWGKLTDDDLEQIAGEKDKLVGKLQERYGYARDEAQRQVNDFYGQYEAHQPGMRPEIHTGGRAADGTPDTRGITEKIADAVTGDRIDDKTGKVVR